MKRIVVVMICVGLITIAVSAIRPLVGVFVGWGVGLLSYHLIPTGRNREWWLALGITLAVSAVVILFVPVGFPAETVGEKIADFLAAAFTIGGAAFIMTDPLWEYAVERKMKRLTKGPTTESVGGE